MASAWVPPQDNPLVAQVTDPEGRLVGLYRRTWEEKILRDHSGVDLAWVIRAIERPAFIIVNDVHNSLNYLEFMNVHRFRLVSAKPRANQNPPYVVVTAYPTAIPPYHHGRIIWKRS